MDENKPDDMLEVPETTPANDGIASALRWTALLAAIGFVITAIVLYLANG